MQDSTFCDNLLGTYAFYPLKDNLVLNVKPLNCTDKLDWGLTPGSDDDTWFDTYCIPDGSKPTIHVSNKYAVFNITKEANFEGIIFSGLQDSISQTG